MEMTFSYRKCIRRQVMIRTVDLERSTMRWCLGILVALLAGQAAIGQTAPPKLLDDREDPRVLQPLAPIVGNQNVRRRSETEAFFSEQRFLPQPNDAEIDRLRKLKLQAAAKLVGIRLERFKAGADTLDSVADAIQRLLDCYLSFEESDQHRVEVFRSILQPVIDTERFTRARLEHGISTVSDAALARYFRLHITIQIIQELPDDAGDMLFDLHFPPIHPSLVQKEVLADLEVSRPSLDIGDRPDELPKAIPAILQPVAIEIEDDLVRLRKRKYNTSTLEIAALSTGYAQGQSSIVRVWDAAERLVSSASELELPASEEAGLLEQLTLLANAQRRSVVQRINAGVGSTRELALAEYRLFDTALSLARLLHEEGLNSDLSIVELMEKTDVGKKLAGRIVEDYPNLIRLRMQTGDLENHLVQSLGIARCNAASEYLVEAFSRHSAGSDSNSATLLAIERLLESALAIEEEAATRERIVTEAVEFSKQLEQEVKTKLEMGIGRSEDHPLAEFLHLDLAALRLMQHENPRH
jgi:hypothetical protein